MDKMMKNIEIIEKINILPAAYEDRTEQITVQAAQIETLVAQLKTLQEQLKSQAETIAKQQVLIKWYENQFLLMQHHRFGASSEKTNPDFRQLNLFGEASEVKPPEPEPETEEIIYNRKKRKGKREEDLSGLEVERIDHELTEEERICPECGETMRDIGVYVRRELKLIPAKVVVVEHAAHTYACDNCEKTNDNTPIVNARNPEPLISGSLASPSLVAHIACQKYMNGLPLYRIERGFQYDGIVVSRQTMSNWVINCTEMYLVRIYTLLTVRLLAEGIIHADETTVQVLHEAGRDAKTKSYEWVYRTGSGCDVHIVIYDYRQTRKYEHPKKFLENFKGFVHSDGYQAYHELPETITVVGCWAHVRRYFNDALKIIPKDKRESSEAWIGISFINKLFSLEHDFENLTPQERYEERLKQSKPVADAFFEWVSRLGVLPKMPIGKAATYALNQRVFLENVFLDGRLELSNNRCERSVKPFVMGRKCWLFSNTPRGAVSSSIMYSIIETARENGLNPFQYVKFLLETVPTASDAELNNLLPWSETLPECCKAAVTQAGAKTAASDELA